VDVCALKTQGRTLVVSSRPFRVPEFDDPFSASDKKSRSYALIRLSGLNDSCILYNADRVSRLHQRQ
jgi:hypothetical protein